jgi:GNAT superfamily N-acetyltransferase
MTATQHGQEVASVSLWFPEALRMEGKAAVLFGKYICTDESAATALLNAACEQAKQRGCGFAIGPMDGSTWENYRFKTADAQPYLLGPENPLSYPAQWEATGFEPIAKYFSATAESWTVPEIHETRLAQSREKGIALSFLDTDQPERDLRDLHALSHEAFREHFLYQPIAAADFIAKYLPLMPLVDRRFVVLTRNAEGELVAFAFCFRDRYRPDTLIIKTLARKPGRAWAGLGDLVVTEAMRNAQQAGCTRFLHALMIDQGDATGLSLRKHGGQITHHYALYGKRL